MKVEVRETIVEISEGVIVNKCRPRSVLQPPQPPPLPQTPTLIRGKREIEERIKKRMEISKTVGTITTIITVKPKMI